MFGGGAELNKCALYLCVQCLGASALCPEVCTKIIIFRKFEKVLCFRDRRERDGEINVHIIMCSIYRRRKKGGVLSV